MTRGNSPGPTTTPKDRLLKMCKDRVNEMGSVKYTVLVHTDLIYYITLVEV